MRWILQVPQIIETADDMSKEQLIEQLVQQQVLRGPADAFTLEQVDEQEQEPKKQELENESIQTN